jgi:uncharacterized cupin superfamily protein
MPIRKLNINEIIPFDYKFDGPIGGQMADVGRSIGSRTIGLNIQTVQPGHFSSRRHRHIFQEEILVVMSGTGLLHHGDERLPVGPGDAVCYHAADPDAHTFENTGTVPLVIWAFGNRLSHEVCEYPDHGVAFVEGLGAEIPLAHLTASEWTEERRRR